MISSILKYVPYYLIFGVCSLAGLHGQESDFFLGPTRYSFINYAENRIILPENQQTFDTFFNTLEKITRGMPRQLRILHLGESHIQADYMTFQIRKRMQQLEPDMQGSRGLIFPYSLAQTNNPQNFNVAFTGHWEVCKNTQMTNGCRLGLTGMAVYTSDPSAWISIRLVNGTDYYADFDSVRIFHEPSPYQLRLITRIDTVAGSYDAGMGCTHFRLSQPSTYLKLEISSTGTSGRFGLLGISLDSDAPGIVYDAVGVNGARLSSYLGCTLYEQHLKAIHPDLVIISIGTNDGYTRNFKADYYYRDYKTLLSRTLSVLPDAAVILTVPNDSYLYKRYVNPNNEAIRELTFRLAKEFECGIWDFYTIMGGLNSARAWFSLGLMKPDRIHFTKEGYILSGELFFSAFLQEWEKRIHKIVLP